MSRGMTSFAIALGCAVALNAQDATKPEVKSNVAKTVSYSGCVQTGTEAHSFVLAKVVPVGLTTTTAVGTAGTTTTTTYALVPVEKIEFQPHVGHKVEVTGIVIPAGDTKTETTSKTERPDDNAMPQFRVISIKQVADNCS